MTHESEKWVWGMRRGWRGKGEGRESRRRRRGRREEEKGRREGRRVRGLVRQKIYILKNTYDAKLI